MVNLLATKDPTDAQGDMRLREIEHRHSNLMQIVSGLLRSRERMADHDETREAFRYATDLLHAVSTLNRLSAKESGGSVSDHLNSLSKQWRAICDDRIAIILRCGNLGPLSQSEKVVVGLLAQELVFNAIKHAFPDGRRGDIKVFVSCQEDQTALLIVEDDGIGLAGGVREASMQRKESRGMGLLAHLTSVIKGTMIAEAPTSRGHRVSITWPLRAD
ncbi:ATP-binding protein [Pseudoroseicyclus aestuarii]|uniref:histidine kinase n=1 Tax=Pseudoroseicyclus aestuarii TaxID=1795041 RepID=A0A318SYN7_9RHOB|nr:ATP-binding protein [Pseudoroseicyclus aestuarii]PYE80847.1 two-component sensor histidine kinase [Pseudoroseicyclus aestuarii]